MNASSMAGHKGEIAKSVFAEETETLKLPVSNLTVSLWCCSQICHLEHNKAANSLRKTEKLLRDINVTRIGMHSFFHQSIYPQVSGNREGASRSHPLN